MPGSKPGLDHIIFHEFDRFRFLFFMVTGVQTIHRQEARVLSGDYFLSLEYTLTTPPPPQKKSHAEFQHRKKPNTLATG